MSKMASRSMSAASLASKRIEGRVIGRLLPGSGSVETFKMVLIACSCDAIDVPAILWLSSSETFLVLRQIIAFKSLDVAEGR